MDITITMTEEQSDSVNELIINHLEFLADEYDIDPEDPTSAMDEHPDQVDEYIGLHMVSEEFKASWKNAQAIQSVEFKNPPPKFYKRPSDGFFYYLDEYEDEILCCFPDPDDEERPDTDTTLYLRDCQSEFENGDTFESIVAEVDPILRGYELKRKTDRSL